MTHAQKAVRELFFAAVDLAPVDREAFLAQATTDEHLRARVAAALRDHDAAGAFLAAPTMELDLDAVARPGPSQAATGRAAPRIDGFTIHERIGQGGFSDVYRATQHAPVPREVAIKVLRADVFDRRAWTRLARERRAMAMMEHPNIARVLGAGATEQGQPYFVLELLRGEPITEHCTRRELGLAGRLELFRDVCAAVRHAHERGVVHRDLKPSNILVCDDEGIARVKVIDFGIAKFTYGNPLSTDQPMTQEGWILGTPGYVSPEQLRGGSHAVDARSDIYTLGILAYELLTGSHPHRLPSQPATATPPIAASRRTDLGEPRRTVAPALPSRRLLAIARAMPSGTQQSSTLQTARRLRGNLDRLTMRAMAFEPEARYGTVQELLDDLDRHFDGKPVSARLDRSASRVVRSETRGKPWRRGKLAVMAGVATAAAAALAIGTTTLRRMPLDAQIQGRDYTSSISLAALACDAGDLQQANTVLQRIAPAQRGWEWRHLHRRVNPADSTITVGHEVRALAVSPDERLVATVTGGEAIVLLDPESGATAGHVTCRGITPRAVVFAPHGRAIAATGVIKVSDHESGIELHRLPSRTPDWTATGSLSHSPFSPDGTSIVASRRNELVFLATSSGATISSIHCGPLRITGAVFAANSHRVYALAVDTENRAKKLVTLDGAEIRTRDLPRPLSAARIHPEHQLITGMTPGSGAMGIALPELTVAWQIDMPQARHSLHCSLSPDGELAIAVDQLGVRVLDLVSRAQLHVPMPESTMTCCAVGTMRGHLYFGTRQREISILRYTDTGVRTVIPQFDRWRQMGAAFNADASLVLTTGWGSLRLWDCRTDQLRWARNLGSTDLLRASFTADGQRVAVADRAGTITLLETISGTVLGTYAVSDAPVIGMVWHDERGELDVATKHRSHVFRPGAEERSPHTSTRRTPLARLVEFDRRLYSLPVRPEDDIECRATTDSRLTWHSRLRCPGRSGSPTAGAATRDQVAIGFSDGSLQVRSANDGTLMTEAVIADTAITALAFTRRGERLAVATKNTLLLVDPANPSLPIALAHGLKGVIAVAFSAGDDTLLAATTDQVLRLETVATSSEHRARRWLSHRVRGLLTQVWTQLRLAEDITSELAQMGDLPANLRQAALEHVAAQGDFLNGLHSDALWYARRREAPPEMHARAATALLRLALRTPLRASEFDLTLALLEHRLQRDELARQRVLARTQARPTGRPRDRTVTAASLALIEQGRGDLGAARLARQVMEAAARDAHGQLDETARILVAEVRLLVDAATTEEPSGSETTPLDSNSVQPGR